MKTTTFEKKRNALASILFAGIISASGFAATTLSASAAKISSPSIEEQIFEVCQYQNAVDGVELTNQEEKDLMNEIGDTIRDYAAENGYTYSEAGKNILAEMVMETGYGTQLNAGIAPCSSGTGTTQLPTSSKGDIFFTDNNAAWNHVGMYTTTIRIIESMPDYGVHEVPISDPTALQATTGESHDQSCILRVRGVTDKQVTGAIGWAMPHVGKPYDNDFINNKANTDSENAKFNCSELVWKSFNFGANIDLDSNGGLAVYPNNIYNSSMVYQVRSF